MTELTLTRCDHSIDTGRFIAYCGKVRSAPCSATCRVGMQAVKPKGGDS